ncbi:MAG: DUF262 domain-containing protein, partial [Candidatus Heimdallarchaeaceae archaeon]
MEFTGSCIGCQINDYKNYTRIKNKITAEEQAKQYNERRLIELRKKTIATPTILREIGDRVQRGNIDKSIITEILDDGKILKLEETFAGHKNSKNVGKITHRIDYVAWMDIVTYKTSGEINKTESFRTNLDVFINYQNRDVNGLRSKYYSFGLDMNPDYQRGNVWDIEDKRSLIESMFNNIDIGKFVVIHSGDYSAKYLYEVLDGKQRIQTLLDFMESRFTYKGKTFDELHPRDQWHIKDYPISLGEIKSLSGDNKLTTKQKYKQFLKLNTCGKLVDPEHIEYVRGLYK